MKITCLNTSCLQRIKMRDSIEMRDKPAKELHNNDETEEGVERTTHNKRYVSPEERQQVIDELRLVPKNY